MPPITSGVHGDPLERHEVSVLASVPPAISAQAQRMSGVHGGRRDYLLLNDGQLFMDKDRL
jgi:hypothetical protein